MNKKFICTVCGYIHEGPEPPERCPQCKVPASKFKELEETEGGLQFVQEHVIGIANEYGIDDEMRKDLNAHWNGECTEEGMYLAMSRQADREGYPEIAEAFKAVMKSCDDQVKQSQMTQEKHTFREKLEKNFGAELDKQIDQWLKAERCADFKDIATKANLTSFNP